MSSSFVTPLRYPGGKGRLGAWLAELIKNNGLTDGNYIEPYAGGAGAAVYLLVNKHVKHITINDLDPVIYSFWWSLVNDTDRLVNLIEKTPVNMDFWYQQQEIVKNQDLEDKTKLGFATFFLNRTNRSGIIKGGVIGGKNQNGKYKIDARYKKEKLISRILNIAKHKGQITVSNNDALGVIGEYGDSEKTFIYLDPPYFNKGSQLYRNHYAPEDHLVIRNAVREVTSPCLITYDNCQEIVDLYSEENCIKMVEFSLRYSTHSDRPYATELMMYKNIKKMTEPKLRR